MDLQELVQNTHTSLDRFMHYHQDTKKNADEIINVARHLVEKLQDLELSIDLIINTYEQSI